MKSEEVSQSKESVGKLQSKHTEENTRNNQADKNLQNNQIEYISSSEVEVRLNECVKKSDLSVLDIRALVVRCSSCGRQINHYSNKEVKKHRRLGVITCKECYDFYGSSEFSQDEAGYKYCTWCGNGGKLLVCDYCPNGFCSACIRRNFGRAEITIVAKEGWKCYCCNQSRLKPKMKFCDMIMEYEKIKTTMKKDKKPVSHTQKKIVNEKWLQAAFDEGEEACKHFHKKMMQLKAIGVNKSKNLKHIVKKMDQVINNHRSNLKNIVNNLSKEFSSYIELKIKTDEERLSAEFNSNNDTNEVIINDDKSNDVIILDCTSVTSLSNNDDCILIEETPEKNISVNNKTHTVEVQELQEAEDVQETQDVQEVQIVREAQNVQEDQDVEEAQNVQEDQDVEEANMIQAKLSLLQTSSESDGEDSTILTPIREHNTNSNHSAPMNVSEKIFSSDDSTRSPKAKQKLNFDTPSSSDSESHNLRTKSNRVQTSRDIDVQDTNRTIKEMDIKNDPKLKLEIEVRVVSCENLLNGERSVKVSYSDTANDIDSEEKLDKRIDSLCKFPKHTATNGEGKPRTVIGPKSKARPQKSESSSSISLSSDDEVNKTQAATKIIKKDVKADLLNSDSDSSSSISLGSEEEEEKKKSKKIEI